MICQKCKTSWTADMRDCPSDDCGGAAEDICQHDWHLGEQLDDEGTTRWECWRCASTVALDAGDSP